MKFKISQIFNVASQNLLPHDVCLPQICQTCAKIFAKSIPVRTYCAPCSWDCSVPVPPIKPHHYDILTIFWPGCCCAGATVRRASPARIARRPTCRVTRPRARMAVNAIHSDRTTILASAPQVCTQYLIMVGTLNVMKTVAETWSAYPP